MNARAIAALCVVATTIACDDATPPPTDDVPPLAPFTVRGRLADPRALTFRIEADETLPALDAAVERAVSDWAALGPVQFRPARDNDGDAIVFAWRRGAHASCPPFGAGPARAHAGPVAAVSFVHFDAEHAWDEDALHRAALHELGHVLGLGHGDAPDSILQPDPPATIRTLAEADRCGLHSLYGGGSDRAGDLRILRDGRELAPTLRQVAPPSRSEHAMFDTDGDGDHELCVWRTDRDGHGTLTIHHFAPGPRLDRTVGPFYGATDPGARAGFARTGSGERLFVTVFDDGRRIARAFDAHGLLRQEAPRDPPAPEPLSHEGDLDGDGSIERVERAARTP